jgi:hypothetical protein
VVVVVVVEVEVELLLVLHVLPPSAHSILTSSRKLKTSTHARRTG